jgi:hypothetical protein
MALESMLMGRALVFRWSNISAFDCLMRMIGDVFAASRVLDNDM